MTSHNTGRLVRPRCIIRAPGHGTHWIQVSLARDRPVVPQVVDVLEVGDRWLDAQTEDGSVRRLYNHDPERSRRAAEASCGVAALTGWGTLRFLTGDIFSMESDPEKFEPCLTEWDPQRKIRVAGSELGMEQRERKRR